MTSEHYLTAADILLSAGNIGMLFVLLRRIRELALLLVNDAHQRTLAITSFTRMTSQVRSSAAESHAAEVLEAQNQAITDSSTFEIHARWGFPP